MDFPQRASLTLTNACNLKCKMCGQWSNEGYMHGMKENLKQEMTLLEWKSCVVELAEHNITSVLLRGGETFLYPDIIELLEYFKSKGIFTSIDTNGTQLKKFAEDIIRIGNIHLTISIDGPEQIHDNVRGIKGTFKRVKEGIDLLNELETKKDKKISKAINFTISGFSYKGLGVMPDVARNLSINMISIVPYYYFPEHVGKAYEAEMATHLDCKAYSWRGFHHENSGVDFEEFKAEYRKYLTNLGDIHNYLFIDFSEDDYRVWFTDPLTPVEPLQCNAIEKWIDIQPSGDANFCVDFPDYVIGNVRESTIEKIWNSEKAERFRAYRRRRPLPICYRCGAKYMSE